MDLELQATTTNHSQDKKNLDWEESMSDIQSPKHILEKCILP